MFPHNHGKAYRAAQGTSDTIRGAKLSTQNYKLSTPPVGDNRVNIIDTTRGALGRNNTPKGEWVARFDGPHAGHHKYPHINVNPKVARIARDPHIEISARTLNATTKAAKVLQKANKVMVPVAIGLDTARVGSNIYYDYNKGTTRNTVESLASVGGGWGGGWGGAVGGAALGTMGLPGVGTIIGGVVGGISGAIGGSYAAEGVTHVIGDSLDYDIIHVKCKKCGKKFKCRKYTDESRSYCQTCESSNQ